MLALYIIIHIKQNGLLFTSGPLEKTKLTQVYREILSRALYMISQW